MIIPKYYVIELLEDYKINFICDLKYHKGERVMAWYNEDTKMYWTANTNDCIHESVVKIICEFEVSKVYE